MANRRLRYTKYEISKLIKEKFKKSNLNLNEFCQIYNINKKTLIDICEAKISFDKGVLSICSIILKKDIEELLSEDIDEERVILENGKINKITAKSYNLANVLFNEIIMQNKIQ
ncbi:hypothetical protein QIW52_17530 [Clostridioides difficile]|nr:hypothetical protein [Clostridioides difficile]